VEMPRMNGLELAAHVRAQKSTEHIPMIMITSRSTEKHRQKARAAGVNAYLTKPFSEDELIDQIQVALAPSEATHPGAPPDVELIAQGLPHMPFPILKSLNAIITP